ncbi:MULTISPECIES: helix-turn-helix domain-containing protein [unclassified Neorhizobium]|uniref:winged helix-turn-helix transcriptional regulator n=1 Tax=unclassified Neorhizobium TaxID=2629175 RepID=UPI001FF67207|nr:MULTISPECIES: helix-turn-helix domain-containing protein [unclassified Neorhizobium]MCJ9672148.1 helix-turn-helix transcriptional regulator [Neorhizobium sp. SHOUNA12B]MCJ9748025.1 helix-turn-helix transcriptional regulator [Neorhizobium sp. SHOUNA12A]
MSEALFDNHGGDFLPVETALGLLSGKWKCIVLFQLLDGTARFSELRRRLPAITQKTLTNQLRELEQAGLIERRVYAQVPARVDYTISPFGLTLEPILRALQGWGQSFGKIREQILFPGPGQMPPSPSCDEETRLG